MGLFVKWYSGWVVKFEGDYVGDCAAPRLQSVVTKSPGKLPGYVIGRNLTREHNAKDLGRCKKLQTWLSWPEHLRVLVGTIILRMRIIIHVVARHTFVYRECKAMSKK